MNKETRTVTVFVSYDGWEFSDPVQCLRHEDLQRKIDAIVSRLTKPPEGADFMNGYGYIQHAPAEVAAVRADLLALARSLDQDPNSSVAAAITGRPVHPSYLTFYFSECSASEFRRAWGRMDSIDSEFREWGQPYFASHPDRARSRVCLNVQPAQPTNA